MISEVFNSLFLTYLASEYLLASHNLQRKEQLLHHHHPKIRLAAACLFCAVVNLLDHYTGTAAFANNVLKGFFHIPRVIVAATAYSGALYIDCHRNCVTVGGGGGALSIWSEFLPAVGHAFVRILPLYPFLAVLISFGFLLVINLFETLHLPLEWLNWPIYYGTLYGPFSFVYVQVKQRIIQDRYYSLPLKR